MRSETDMLRQKWDARYREASAYPLPSEVLTENQHLLPSSGRCLDLASGLGANALLLAEKNLQVEAWDISEEATRRLEQEAQRRALSVTAITRDVEVHPPEPDTFDIIVVTHFLDRSLFPGLSNALSPGGLLFYQTYSKECVTSAGPSNSEFRLDRRELLSSFPGLIVRVYREEGSAGAVELGFRDKAMLVAQKLHR